MTTHRITGFEPPEDEECVPVVVDGRQLAVALEGGELHAFDDLCTHEQCNLSYEGGQIEDGKVVCGCHMGTFDLRTGRVLGGPPKAPLGIYPVRLADGVLEIDL